MGLLAVGTWPHECHRHPDPHSALNRSMVHGLSSKKVNKPLGPVECVTPQCYGCIKTLASHEHVHHHLIHKNHTMMNVIISYVLLFELLDFMLAFVCAHVLSMQLCAKCPLKQLSYT